jgi:hypothetical protein
VHVKSAPLTLHKSYFNELLLFLFLIPTSVNALPFKQFEQVNKHSSPLASHYSAWPVNVSKFFSIPASSCHIISPSFFGLIKWQLVSRPSSSPTHTENGTGWLGISSRPPALLGTPFHARTSHSWRAHGLPSFTSTNPRLKNAGWLFVFLSSHVMFPTAFHAHPSRLCSGGESQRAFAMSEALKKSKSYSKLPA